MGGVWEHNHIEDGHVSDDIPRGSPEQNAIWEKLTWKKAFGYLASDSTVKRIEGCHLV